MKVCIIDNNNIFVNTQIIDPMKALPAGTTIVDEPIIPNGMFAKWVDKEWVIISEYPSEPTLTIEVPQTITPLQAKLQLLEMELLDEVEAMVATDRKISLYWNEALEIRRDHTTLLAMASALSLSDEQLDSMFIEASKLS